MEKTIAGKQIAMSEDGFLTDFSQWNIEVAEQIAKDSHIELSKRHWEVLNYLQEQFRKEVPMSIRKIKNSDVVDIKEFYQLFPQGPLKTASKIAGIPKPTSCL
jgi:tRNA 2-thiouridine synthesizing protein E